MHRRGLGPAPFHVRHLSATRLAQGLREGLDRLDEYTMNAEALSEKMHREDGVGTAVALIEVAAAGCALRAGPRSGLAAAVGWGGG